MRTRTYQFVALQMNQNDPAYSSYLGRPVIEKIDFIIEQIRKSCKLLEKQVPDSHYIFAWPEYGLDVQSMSPDQKKYFKDKMSQLTAEYPLTIIAGTVVVEKQIKPMNDERINKIVGYYQNSTFMSYEKQDLLDKLERNREKYLQEGATVVRNVCYIFEGGKCIYRYDKSEPFNEIDPRRQDVIFQPGNKHGNHPVINICHNELTLFLEICFEHQQRLASQFKLDTDLQLLISNTTNMNLDNINSPLFIQMDVNHFAFPIASKNDKAPIEFRRVNLNDSDMSELKQTLPITFLSNSLFLACYKDDEQQISKILASPGLRNMSTKSEIELYGTSSLHLMIEKRQDTNFILALLKFGADVNAIDKEKQTPLYLAVKTKQDDIVELLLEKGAKVDEPQNRLTPLALAVKNKDLNCVELLVKAKANVNVNIDGEPLVIYAMQSQCWDVAEQLIKANAYLKLDDDNKEILLDLINQTSNAVKIPLLAHLDLGRRHRIEK